MSSTWTAIGSSVSTAVAASLMALMVGWGLGRIAAQSTATASLLSRFTEWRGAIPGLIAAPLLMRGFGISPQLAIVFVVGFGQGIAMARWIRSRSGEWVPSMMGGIALGRSSVALAARRAAARGSVWVTIALCAPFTVTLEALLSAAHLSPPSMGIGGLLASGFTEPTGPSSGVILLGVFAAALLFVGLDVAARWAVQRQQRH